jgi:uncharacterized protein YqeY
MLIYETISSQMKDALRAKDAKRLAALRNIRAAFLTEVKKDNSDSLDDETCVGLLRRLEKQRRESIEAFEKGGREDRAADEREEMAVIREFLPSLADEEVTRGWVAEAIAETGAAGPRDVGRVMGALMKAHRGEVDGALVKRIVSEILSQHPSE